MKRFAFDLSGYLDRVVPEYPNAVNVFQYYENDWAASSKATGMAYNGEFVHGFPTVALICETIQKSDSPGLNTKVEEAYQQAARMHGPDVAGGFLADCIATGMYLVLSHNPKAKFVS